MKPKSRKGASRAGKPARRQAKDWRPAVKLLTDTLADLDPRNKAAEDQLLELLFLSRALDSLDFPVRRAEHWVRPADFPKWLDKVEKHIRAVWNLIDIHFRESPLASSGDDEQERAQHVIYDLGLVRKNLDLVAKIRADWTRTPPDFSAEREELQRLRAGELNAKPHSNGARS
jgi:hypothetical protein